MGGSTAYSFASDTWSFAIIVWEILMNGETPWPRLKDRHVRRREILEHMQRTSLSLPDGAPQWMKDLTRLCWRHDPAKRCHITKALATIKAEVKLLKAAAQLGSPSSKT